MQNMKYYFTQKCQISLIIYITSSSFEFNAIALFELVVCKHKIVWAFYETSQLIINKKMKISTNKTLSRIYNLEYDLDYDEINLNLQIWVLLTFVSVRKRIYVWVLHVYILM